ncbi:Glutathione S-transferase 1 [Formica fusca]
MELIMLNIQAGEHLTSEYEQLNPQKTIPFLVDDDVKISERLLDSTWTIMKMLLIGWKKFKHLHLDTRRLTASHSKYLKNS